MISALLFGRTRFAVSISQRVAVLISLPHQACQLLMPICHLQVSVTAIND